MVLNLTTISKTKTLFISSMTFVQVIAAAVIPVFLQVTEETSEVLQKLGYSCECRGFIDVKGKGELKTFFVCTDMSKQQGMGLS